METSKDHIWDLLLINYHYLSLFPPNSFMYSIKICVKKKWCDDVIKMKRYSIILNGYD